MTTETPSEPYILEAQHGQERICQAGPLIQIDIVKASLRALGVPHRRVLVKVLQADGSYRFLEDLASLYCLLSLIILIRAQGVASPALTKA